MNSERNIFIAFILNLSFSVFEFFGGLFTGSMAILSDALHDAADALSIGLSYFLEKKSKKQPDAKYTYGYGRYSILGGFLTTAILIVGSVFVIYNAIGRLIRPVPIHYDGMILFAAVGVCVNSCAAFFTRSGSSLNQKAVNLHMLEDVLGWVVVLVGAVVMRLTDLPYLDPILSITVSLFILLNALRNMLAVADLFLEKMPRDVSLQQIKTAIRQVDGVLDVHHIHIWSIDGLNHSATMHIVTDQDPQQVKAQLRRALRAYSIGHVTIETETSDASCQDRHCQKDLHSHCGRGHCCHGHLHHH